MTIDANLIAYYANQAETFAKTAAMIECGRRTRSHYGSLRNVAQRAVETIGAMLATVETNPVPGHVAESKKIQARRVATLRQALEDARYAYRVADERFVPV